MFTAVRDSSLPDLAFNDFIALMVAWYLWIFGVLVMSGIGLIIKRTIVVVVAANVMGAGLYRLRKPAKAALVAQ